MAIRCCKDCHVQFEKSTAYLAHRRNEHSKFCCKNCGRVFGIKKKFKNHTRGCRGNRRLEKPNETRSRSIISLSDYKRLPIVTAEELDAQFKIYIDRKFGKRDVFRNEKMCKFCCKSFAIASDFADHIREHYTSIPLDATGVKSKFDFMKFMGLKIREASDTDCSDANTTERSEDILKKKILECKVVVTGERCKICGESFKCITDLNLHTKKKHLQYRNNKVTLVLRIGEEIISRIPLRMRHIRRGGRTTSKSRRLRNERDEVYKAMKYYKNFEVNRGETDVALSRGESPSNDSTCGGKQSWELQERNMRSEKEWGGLCSREKISQPSGNTIRCPGTRGSKFGEVELDTADIARTTFGLYEPSCRGDKGTYELEPTEMYADEYFENMQFTEPWKDEILSDHVPWYPVAKFEQRTDEEDCLCMEPIQPLLLPKKQLVSEEEDHNMADQQSRNYHKISISGFPSIRKYSSDSKYHTDFSFPSDEESYDFQIQAHRFKENSDDEDDSEDGRYVVKKPDTMMSGYTGRIVVREKGTNLSVDYPRSFAHTSDEDQILGADTNPVDPINERPAVFIKEEIILDDYT